MTGPLIVGVLVAGALWLLLQPGRIRTVLAFVLLSHAANVTVLLASTGRGTGAPFVGAEDAADPLPQAFVLTAIVISFGTTAFLLALAGGRHEDVTREERDAEDADDEDGAEQPERSSEDADGGRGTADTEEGR